MGNSEAFDKLLSTLDQDPEIADFQLFSHNNTVVKAGFVQEQLGMIYRPVQKHVNYGLKYLVVLADGRVAQGKLSSSSLQDILKLVEFIKSAAIKLATPTRLAPVPKKYVPVQLEDKDLSSIISSHPEEITPKTKAFMKAQLSYDLESVEGEVEFKHRDFRFIGSHGLDMSAVETGSWFNVEYNSELGATKRDVGVVEESELVKLSEVAELAKLLKAPPAKIESGTYPLLFEPYNGFGLLDAFVLSNLRGVSVEAGVSRFGLADFQAHKTIAHAELQLAVDQTKPMDLDSFSFTGEGIVGQRFEIIKAGQLTEPICDLQTAKQLKATPRVLGSLSTAQITGSDYQQFVKDHPKFVLILSTLGIHTQNGVAGTYSLPCPSAIYFENGRPVGPLNCVITGDFFEKLQAPQTGFTQLDMYQKPSLHFESDLTVKSS